MKKLLAFDLDDTLAPSKSPLPDRIAEVLTELLDNFQVCVISGGRFEQFQMQLLDNLKADPSKLQRLHLMPTCGTRYYLHNAVRSEWELQYAEDIDDADKARIIAAIEEGVEALGLKEAKTYGPTIEDRLSQITFSALGQNIAAELGEEGVAMKAAWDPTGEKRTALRDFVAEKVPEYEVRAGGGTSIDITRPGIDKAYGMQKLIDTLDISRDDILFFGDRLQPGGNDYPVKAMGIDSLEVHHWEDTAARLETILALLKD